MRAIILAAGQCRRLRPYTDTIPKCLLDINGKNILGRQLEMLITNGIKEVVIVVGYKADSIVEYVNTEYHNLNVIWVKNTDYDTTNNGYSLQLALEITGTSPFILLNSDVVCHSDVVAELLSSGVSDCMAVMRKSVSIPEDMKVKITSENRIIKVNKELDESIGEFTGIAKFEKSGELFLEILKNTGRNEWFEKALDILLSKVEVMMTDVSHYPSIEIDTPEDLVEARDLFIWGWPDWEFGIRHKSAEACERNMDDCFNLLDDLITLFEAHNIVYWMNWGALLGLYRDGDFIPWDTDIDVTIHERDVNTVDTIIIPIMKKLGCFVPKTEICCSGDRWFIRNKEKIELNWVVSDQDKYVYAPGRCNLACPKHYIDNLSKLFWRGLELSIPSNTDKYLELSYGKDWRKPIRGRKPVTL
jgi:choline kinase